MVTWAGIATERFAIIAGADQLVRHQSSPGAVRSFCRRCGSSLLFESERWPGEVHVAVANLDVADIQAELGVPLAAHVFYSNHAAWFTATDALPRRGGASGVEPVDG
jgi:hypothetical protein